MIKYLLTAVIYYCIINSCPQYSQVDMQKEIESVKQADIDFSDLSKEKGMKEAFLSYVAPNGVMLRPYMMPLVGYDEINKLLSDGEIPFTLVWAPLYADVSSSGDMGYTYGTYELTFKDDKDAKDVRKGTYVTVWKKNSEGKWKWVLDTGNLGLEPKKENLTEEK
jgi:ketosteroid isomerase-like protein